jgi:hypothetical protein
VFFTDEHDPTATLPKPRVAEPLVPPRAPSSAWGPVPVLPEAAAAAAVVVVRPEAAAFTTRRGEEADEEQSAGGGGGGCEVASVGSSSCGEYEHSPPPPIHVTVLCPVSAPSGRTPQGSAWRATQGPAFSAKDPL